MYPEVFTIFPEKNGKVVYEGITKAPGISKDTIYERIKFWILKRNNYDLAHNKRVTPEEYKRIAYFNIKKDDPINGELLKNENTRIAFDPSPKFLSFSPPAFTVKYTYHFYVSEEGYHYVIDNFKADYLEEYGSWQKGKYVTNYTKYGIPVANHIEAVWVELYEKARILGFYAKIDDYIRSTIRSLDSTMLQQ